MNDLTCIVAATDLGAEAQGSRGSAAIAAFHILAEITRHSLQPSLIEVYAPERQSLNECKTADVWYLDENLSMITQVQHAVRAAFRKSDRIVTIGGDHSASIGAILETKARTADLNRRLGLMWIDSHPDLNTPETSPSGRLHGMALATVLGLNPALPQLNTSSHLTPDDVLIVGISAIDPGESFSLEALNITAFGAEEAGHPRCCSTIDRWSQRFDDIYVSIDLDVIHHEIAPGVNAPVPGGVKLTLLKNVLDAISKKKVLAWDIVEFNARRDVQHATLSVVEWLTRNMMDEPPR